MEKQHSETVQAWSLPPPRLNPSSASYYQYDLGNVITSLGLEFLVRKERLITTYRVGSLWKQNDVTKAKPFA